MPSSERPLYSLPQRLPNMTGESCSLPELRSIIPQKRLRSGIEPGDSTQESSAQNYPPALKPQIAVHNSDGTDGDPISRVKHLIQSWPSPPAATILKLMAFLARDVPELTFLRLVDPQRTWNSDGELEDVPAADRGMNSEIRSLSLANHDTISSTIVQLKNAKLVKSDHQNGTLTLDLKVHELLRLHIEDPYDWELQACLVVCHAFPLHGHGEPL